MSEPETAAAPGASSASGAEGPASLLGISIRGGRARRFPGATARQAAPEAKPADPAQAPTAAPPAPRPAPAGVAAAPPAVAATAAPDGPAPNMETPSGQAPSVGAPGAAVSRPARPSHLRALPAGPAADDGDAPAAGALLAMWRGWRNGGRLPALAKVEGRMAQLCPGGVLLAVARDRVEVAQRLPGAAPDLDLAALDWMRGVARAAARAGMARHELDDEAGLGLVALPFALEVEAGPGSDIASAVLCRVYALEPVEALGGAGGGFFSGMLRRLAGT